MPLNEWDVHNSAFLKLVLFSGEGISPGAYNLQIYLQENEELPKDWTKLFDDQLFQFDPALVPEAMDLYDRIGVKKAPLTLIAPQFETPLPPLQPAVFPPTIREPPPPALELFDLDEVFANEHNRLAQLTNKCSGPEDVEYYLGESAHILGISTKNNVSPKALLAEVCARVVNYKNAGTLANTGFAIGQEKSSISETDFY